jgi:enterochelin esterase-like enzyme
VLRRANFQLRKRRSRLATQISAQAEVEPALLSDAALPLESVHPRLRFHPQFHSQFLPSDRDLTVYLPPGYDESPERSYPVLYLHDGQNLFDPRSSFIPGRTWQVAETADAVIEAGEVESLIIVGIANTGENRLAEYTPTRDWRLGGGDAQRYSDLTIASWRGFSMSGWADLPWADW